MSGLEQSRLKAARALTAEVAEHLRGDLSLELWNGEVLPLGPGASDDVRIVIRSAQAVRRLLLRPGLATLFQLYAEDEIDFSGADPLTASRRFDHIRSLGVARSVDRGLALRSALPFLLGAPARAKSAGYDKAVGAQFEKGRDDKDLVQFHYDLSNAFYRLFLDAQMVYSCAYFGSPETSLDEAQATKLDRICRKLRLKPGDRFLDIGSGWGALVLHAARTYGAQCHGVTLSQAQFDYATAKVAEMGLQDKVTIELRDYRTIEAKGDYDKIAQVGMFEHVGLDNHDRHFAHVRDLLRPRGLYLHHAITRRATPDITKFRQPTGYQKVVTRYIFPGGELDHIGLTITNLDRLGFEVHDVEAMREHYQLTLEHWLSRLYANRDAATAEAGKTKTRLWLLYFTLFARAFERGTVGVFQTLASKRAVGASGLPLARGDLS
jgi:cyclopropane-fatty-acyl-phospholipid synthase